LTMLSTRGLALILTNTAVVLVTTTIKAILLCRCRNIWNCETHEILFRMVE
jgi:hypothetical protein